MVACVVTFLSWQIPALQPTLSHWFVASRRNAFGRWPSLILSAISHAGFFHLIFNLATLLSFGPMVQRTLQQYGGRVSSSSRFSSSSSWPMWPLLLGSALAGSGTHLLMDQSAGGGGGGCMGLSSVTLGIVAVYTRLYPTTTLQIMLAGIIPVRLQAQSLLKFLLAWSALGTLRASMAMGKWASTTAHSAHLGGLLFGLAYYELWARRFHIDQMMRHIKASKQQPNKWWSL
jgi:membrane associated rhomboid family serine protease